MPRSRLIQAMNQQRGKKVAWLALTVSVLARKTSPLIVSTDTVMFSMINNTTKAILTIARPTDLSTVYIHVDAPTTQLRFFLTCFTENTRSSEAMHNGCFNMHSCMKYVENLVA